VETLRAQRGQEAKPTRLVTGCHADILPVFYGLIPAALARLSPGKSRNRKLEIPMDGYRESGLTVFSGITTQFLSSSDVTSQDGALIRVALLDGFPAPIGLYPNRKAIPVRADRPR
jgi:hypothetical protein